MKKICKIIISIILVLILCSCKDKDVKNEKYTVELLSAPTDNYTWLWKYEDPDKKCTVEIESSEFVPFNKTDKNGYTGTQKFVISGLNIEGDCTLVFQSVNIEEKKYKEIDVKYKFSVDDNNNVKMISKKETDR